MIVYLQSEVKIINKQRFLPELGKLLTFMVEEDRQTALAMYSRLFDDAEDEQRLMDLLVSPTRQAVVIARTYDAKARKKQLESAARGNGGEEETPAFVLAIDKLYQQVAPQHPAEPVEEPDIPAIANQFSLFPDDAHPIDDSEYVPFQIEAEAVAIEEPIEELPVEAAQPAAEKAAEELPQEPEASAEEAAAFAPPAAEESPAAPVPFAEPAPMMSAAPDAPLPAAVFDESFDSDYVPATRLKAKVGLLILYVLFAVPLTLLGVVLLLIPTVLVLALAVGVIAAGSAALVAAFSGFPKLADILIVLGAAIIVLAVGLLFLWLFVWFIGGAICGLIRGVIELGRRWCYEEVPV